MIHLTRREKLILNEAYSKGGRIDLVWGLSIPRKCLIASIKRLNRKGFKFVPYGDKNYILEKWPCHV